MDIDELITHAEKGDPKSQTDLGICYFRGYGVESNMEKALFWYLKAATQGEPAAMTNAGRCYMFGIGTDKNVEKAIELLLKACTFNIPEAQSALGIIYMYGEGAIFKPKKAFDLFTCAAESELPEAFNCLGRCYLEGIGVEKNLSKAIAYFVKERNYGEIEFNNFQYICSKININKLNEFVDSKNPDAQCFLAGMYTHGIVVNQDKEKSWDLWCKASLQNNALALFMRGCAYFDTENYIMAEMMFEKAVEVGSIEAPQYLEMTREKIVEAGTYFLVKITDKKFAKKFRDGELYMRSVNGFTDSSMNTARNDSKEGTVSRRTPEFQMGAKGSNIGNRKIFCLYSLDCDNERGYLSPPNSKLLDKEEAFGDTAVLILNGNEFINRVKEAFSKRYKDSFRVSYKRVVYDADTFYKSKSSYCDEFHKPSSYGWQREFRISLDSSNGKLPLKHKTDRLIWQGCTFDNDPNSDYNANQISIDIGCIKDISMEIPINDFVKNIDKMIDDKYVPLDKVPTFFDSRKYTEGLLPVFYNDTSADTFWSDNPLENPRSFKEDKKEKTT